MFIRVCTLMKRKSKTNKETILEQGKEIALLKNEVRELKTVVEGLTKWKHTITSLFEDLYSAVLMGGGEAK